MIHEVLLAGLGQIGMGYDLDQDPSAVAHTHARAFSRHPSFVLGSGVDPDPVRRVVFEQRYGRPAYASMSEALARHRPAVVSIANPTSAHADTLAEALCASSVRAVLCEKPLSYSGVDARKMVALAVSVGVSLFVNYMRRADPAVLEIRRRIACGEIAGPLKGVVWYSKGFLHNGSHFFDLAQFWLGPTTRAQLIDRGRDVGAQDAEPDVRVEFTGGSLVFLSAREEDFSHYTIELVASNGRLRYDDGGANVAWWATRPDPQFDGYTALASVPERLEDGVPYSQLHVADLLAAALEGQVVPLCSGDEAASTIDSMNHIMEMR